MGDITKRFAEGAKRVITVALLCAKELGHTYVGSEHLLLSVIREGGSVSAKLLAEREINYDAVKTKIIGLVGMGCKTVLTGDDMTPVCRRIILRATYLAGNNESASVSIEHLVIAMLSEECVATRILTELNCDIDELLAVLEELYCDNPPAVFLPPEPVKRKNTNATPLLDTHGTDLTEKAKNGGVDPVIGREAEEERLISILLRRSKNNPCLVGEAGVGKTAVVESVALRIATGRVPEELKNKRIIGLELSTVVAGTKYRGEFEEKIKKILDEVRNSSDVILFIDEIHTIVGAGGAEGAIDASNILKPALARGEIRVIGATTLDEFRDSIEKDKALERRFQPVNVVEPDEKECEAMLCGLRKKYETYHNVTITDKAITAAVALSKRYIFDRFLPDKAIDLIDEASAVAKMSRRGKSRAVVDESDVIAAVERRSGIPISSPEYSERERLLGMEGELKKSVIGQDEAIKALCSAIRRVGAGVQAQNRPNASFLFIGESGVGKTQCAKALANAFFKDEKSFIRLDMSEFSEPHSVSKIVGSPPGYVGYGESGNLAERVRRNPYSLVLFDEIEKAHPDVRALLLQILDEGNLTDSKGVKVNFQNTIIILTVNHRTSSAGIGFGSGENRKAVSDAAKFLAPELVYRVDEIVAFKALNREELASVAEIELQKFREKLELRGIKVSLSENFIEKAVASAEGNNARSVARTALRLAEEAVSEFLLNFGSEIGEITLFAENGRGYGKIKQNTY